MNNSDSNDVSFFKLWRNIVINGEIFKFIRIYKNNEIVRLTGLIELREYKEREFIGKLIYSDEDGSDGGILLKGDLPEHGVLKNVDLSSYRIPITNGNVIPQGVKVIHFNRRDGNEIQLSELPCSVTSISNVILKKPYSNNHIPNNITAITFKSIDANEFYDIKFSNSITYLNLNGLGKSIIPPPSPIGTKTSFLPSSLTHLETYYNGSPKSSFPSIPSSVKKLMLITEDFCHFEKGLIPHGVNELVIDGSDRGGIKLADGSLPDSITKLEICFAIGGGEYNQIKPFVIPNSVLDLYIRFTTYPKSFTNIFPNSLTRLTTFSLFNNNPPPEVSELPSTLKYLKINYKEIINKI